MAQPRNDFTRLTGWSAFSARWHSWWALASQVALKLPKVVIQGWAGKCSAVKYLSA